MSLTTQDLVDQVRQSLDEFNEESVSDQHILNVLNRAQRKAANITARRYDEMLLSVHTITTATGVDDEYDLPSDIFARRIESVETQYNTQIYPVDNISRKDSTTFRSTSSQTPFPYYYLVKGNTIKLVPPVQAGTTVRIWYAKKPDNYVLPQGRIQEPLSSSNSFVYVDDIGSSLSTTGTSLNSYCSVIDWQTGAVKGNLQVTALNETSNKVTFKASSLSRSTVLGKTVATSLPSDIAVDDYICTIQGTCIPQLPEAYIDYQVQFAVVEIKRRFGEPNQEDYAALKDYEKELKKMSSGRDRKLRVRKTNSKLGAPSGGLRRYYT